MDQFTSNQDQNDHRSILHISSNTFHQRKCFVFVNLSVREDRVSQQPPGRALTCYFYIFLTYRNV